MARPRSNDTIQAVYNPSANITVLTGLAPAGPDTPVFSLQPSAAVVPLGGTATFTAAASPATGYQWLFNSAPLADGNGISGSHTANLTISNLNIAETGIYSVVATNANPISQQDRNFASSQGVSLSADSFNLYPVITVNGVNGNTYVVQYANSLTPSVTWIGLSTNTVGALSSPGLVVPRLVVPPSRRAKCCTLRFCCTLLLQSIQLNPRFAFTRLVPLSRSRTPKLRIRVS